MAKKIDKIDIFSGGKLDIVKPRFCTLEERIEIDKKSTIKNGAKYIKHDVVDQISNNVELVTKVLKDGLKVNTEVDNALKNNSDYKKAKNPKTPKYLLHYQKTNDKKNMDKMNEDIIESGVILSIGQEVLHGGLPNTKVGDVILTTQTLSTTLAPNMAEDNANHLDKAKDAEELNINILKIESPNIHALVFNGKTKMGHEKEIILEKGLELVIEERTKVSEIERVNEDGSKKMISKYVTKISVKKKLE